MKKKNKPSQEEIQRRTNQLLRILNAKQKAKKKLNSMKQSKKQPPKTEQLNPENNTLIVRSEFSTTPAKKEWIRSLMELSPEAKERLKKKFEELNKKFDEKYKNEHTSEGDKE